MTDQEQIDALKAQVNCLRESIRKATVTDMDITEFHNVLQTTPEQCLAEVKARAIEEYKQNLPNVNGLSVDTWKRMFKV